MEEQEKLFYELREIGNKISNSTNFIQNDFDRLIYDKEINLQDLLRYKSKFIDNSLKLIEEYRIITNNITSLYTRKIVEHFDEEIS